MVSIPYVIIGGVNVPLPTGFRLDPTDEQIVMLYLSRKVLSLPILYLPEIVMPEIALGQFDPWNLPGGDEDKKLFFTREEPEVMQRSFKMKRVSVAGMWRERTEDAVLSADRRDVVAMKRIYTFERTAGSQQNATTQPAQASWTMHEFRLVRTNALEQHLQMIAAASDVPMQFTRYYACKIVRKLRSGGGSSGHDVEASASTS